LFTSLHASEPSSVFVIGGTGAVGRFLLPRLAAAGQGIVALSRTPQPVQSSITWVQGGLDAELAAPETGSLICAGPLDYFVDWLERAPTPALRRIVALSSMSADSKRESLDVAERALAARLADAESRLFVCAQSRGVAATVLRPTLIYGAGIDRSLTPIAQLARRTRVFPLIPGASGLRQPVHADDIAATCVAALSGAAAGRVLPLGGGERLSFAAMLARVREGLGVKTLPLPLAINLLRGVSRVTGRGGGMLQRLKHDLVADNASVTECLGITPRDFRPGPDCWEPQSPPF
jgi:nucleoside-diphosphate-sugar epimerase